MESGLEQRIDQLRLLEWQDLTSATGIKTKVWTARPEALAGIPVLQETLTLSPSDLSNTQTLSATWNGTFAPITSVSAGPALSNSSAVKVVATLTWRSVRTGKTQVRSLVTVISRGGLSRSDRM